MDNVKNWVTTKKDVVEAIDELEKIIFHSMRLHYYYSPELMQQMGKIRAIVDHLPLKEN